MKKRAARQQIAHVDLTCQVALQRLDSVGLWITDPIVHAMFVLTERGLHPPFRHLPMPVAFRACGGLRAWNSVFEALPALRSIRDMASNPDEPAGNVLKTLSVLMESLCLRDATDEKTGREATNYALSRLGHASVALSFWLRGGSLYEPTPALGSLLGGADFSLDLPVSLLRPPKNTMCILVPVEHRRRCADVESILVFTSHPKCTETGRTQRAIALHATRANGAGVIQEFHLRLDIDDETRTVHDLLTELIKCCQRDGDDRYASMQALWSTVLDYTVKTLLYLSLDDATISQDRAYSNAPTTFPGLGRRKRELRQAQTEQLYDRYIVGPARAADWAGAQAGELSLDGQVSPHWRRGHFRQQMYGLRGKQRKLIFIKPTLIRADLFDAAQSEGKPATMTRN
ncbi:hypothetical protein [Variovorax boronicumulans]|uniref:hypothetical protein n=1 Tax=Variovorax boronicumulans TaxID=436515 RepID=UPI00339A2AB4